MEPDDPGTPGDARKAGDADLAPPAPAPRRRKPKPTVFEQIRASPASALLVAIDLAVFALAERSGSTTSTLTLLHFGGTWRVLVWEGEYWRLFTSMFLHIGAIHLLFNTYFGFQLSSRVEQLIGARRLLPLYVSSGVAGSALSVIGHNAVSAGASGALFGLIGWEFMTLRLRIGSFRGMWSDVAIRTNIIWIGAWFVLGAYAGFDNFAHAGGLMFGLAFAASLEAPAPRRRAAFAATFLALAILVGLATRPLPFVHTGDDASRLGASRDAAGCPIFAPIGVTNAGQAPRVAPDDTNGVRSRWTSHVTDA